MIIESILGMFEVKIFIDNQKKSGKRFRVGIALCGSLFTTSPTNETMRVLDKFVCFKYSGQTSSLNLTSFFYFVGEKNVQQLGTLLQASRVYV